MHFVCAANSFQAKFTLFKAHEALLYYTIYSFQASFTAAVHGYTIFPVKYF